MRFGSLTQRAAESDSGSMASELVTEKLPRVLMAETLDE